MKLKNILLLNGISSGLTGLLLALMPAFFADIFQVNMVSPFVYVGLFLLPFALFVLTTALKDPIAGKWVQIIISLDVAWVILSAVAVVLLLSSISILGVLLIIGVAAWVGLMAYLQRKASRA